jgi:hypothetical protein
VATWYPRCPRKLTREQRADNATFFAYRKRRLDWSVRVAQIAQTDPEFQYVRPKNDREWRFCTIVVREVLRMGKANGGRVSKRTVIDAGRIAVREAGYREKRSTTIERKAVELLALPRTQQGLYEIFAACGLDVEGVVRPLAEIMQTPLGGDVAPADKIAVANLFFKATTGFAPAKNLNANLHGSGNVDGFYSKEEFKIVPKIKTVSET